MSIDETITVLIAREVFEGAMFTTTHVNAVTRSEFLNDDEKKIQLRRLYYALAAGFSGIYNKLL
jgi:hypothetical protein